MGLIALVPRVYQDSKSNMAAGLSNSTKELGFFLRDLEAYHELKSIQISFAEAHSYPKLFYYYRGAQ